MFDESPLEAGYRSETEHLTAERLPLTITLFLGLVGASGILEYALYPDHLWTFASIYGMQALAFVPLLLGRRLWLRRGWLQRVNIVTWCVVAVLMHAYGAAAGSPRELTVQAGICLMTGTSLLLPWGLRGQLALVMTTALSMALLLSQPPLPSVPSVYLLFGDLAAGAISLFGAYYFELHRFAIYVEATRSEEETSISHSLVAMAKEINDSLDADDVLDRIAGVVRSALHASWSVIIVQAPNRDGFQIVGSTGGVPAPIGSLRGVDFDAASFPLVERVLSTRDPTLIEDDADPAIAGLMQRCETRALLGAALMRRDRTSGVLLTGTNGATGHFSARGRELFRGVAQHVAIALNNVRLVNDLKRANNLKSEFLSTMSHELRTPLNVIIGYADLLRDEAFGPVAGEQPEVLGRLRDNAHSLLELINATLEVNRLEAGHGGVSLREMDLRTLLSELQHETDQIPRQPGVALRWDLPRTSDLVRTDPVKLKIVVRNLIGNALKFTKRGAVSVNVQLDMRARQLDVQVRDTGIGIDPEQLPKIFDMFHQAPTDASTAGVGLGLYIVKRFVDLLGGRISASSKLGEGSVFRLSLPAGLVLSQPVSFEEHRRRRSA